jgi:hypothetical protein
MRPFSTKANEEVIFDCNTMALSLREKKKRMNMFILGIEQTEKN